MKQRVENKVAILLAVYNGGEWLREQLNSILAQNNVEVVIFVSIDPSIDNSGAICEEYSHRFENVSILPTANKSGDGSKNFYRLIQNVDITSFDYIAFADQDDIWEVDKLIRHIKIAKEQNAEGVSSNVLAFWPDGRERLLDKARPQRKLDYIFESAGPGCTFLMTPWLVNKVREQLLDEKSPAKDVALHDWLAYAVCRAHGRKWVVHSQPSVRYRQHGNNVVGANVGLKAKWVRLQKLRQGWYRNEVIKIVEICNSIAPKAETKKLSNLLKNKDFLSQLKLLSYVPQTRRRVFDRCLLSLAIALGLF